MNSAGYAGILKQKNQNGIAATWWGQYRTKKDADGIHKIREGGIRMQMLLLF